MIFKFSGTKIQFIDKLQSEVFLSKNKFLIDIENDTNISIGYKRLGHSDERWFVAKIEYDDNTTYINGDMKVLNKLKEFFETLIMYSILYDILFGISLRIWILLKLPFLFISFLIPLMFLIPLRFYKSNNDIDFIKFMTEKVGCEIIK